MIDLGFVRFSCYVPLVSTEIFKSNSRVYIERSPGVFLDLVSAMKRLFFSAGIDM